MSEVIVWFLLDRQEGFKMGLRLSPSRRKGKVFNQNNQSMVLLLSREAPWFRDSSESYDQ